MRAIMKQQQERQAQIAEEQRRQLALTRGDAHMARDVAGDNEVQASFAGALYAQAMAEPSRREPLLKESASLIDTMPVEFRKLHYGQVLRTCVGAALRGLTRHRAEAQQARTP